MKLLVADGRSTEPLPDVLDRVVRELGAIESRFIALEVMVAELIAVGGTIDAVRFTELQQLDRIRQEIGGIGQFLHSVAAVIPGHWAVDANCSAQTVGLAELGARLGSGTVADSEFSAGDATELF